MLIQPNSSTWLQDYGYHSNETLTQPNTNLMLAQGLRPWPNIEPILEECTMFEV